MKKISPGWVICVVTSLLESAQRGDLCNALLYGDEVVWLPTALPFLTLLEYQFSLNERLPGMPGKEFFSGHPSGEDAAREIKYHQLLMKDIATGNLSIVIPQELQALFRLFDVADDIDRQVKDYGEALQKSDNPALTSPEVVEVLKSLRKNQLHSPVLTSIQNTTRPLVKAMLLGESKGISEFLRKAQACIIDPTSPYAVLKPLHWNAHQEAHTLMEALSRVLLPDVSTLPLLEVPELKEKVKDELNPMRGEMLRLTEDLRQMVKDERAEEEVAREAENLISTRVESVLFEVDRHIKDLLSTRWRRFLPGIVKVISLCGGGYLGLELTKDAVAEALGEVAETLLAQGQQRPPTATAQFVLEIQYQYAESYKY